jgi:hypothetical protein
MKSVGSPLPALRSSRLLDQVRERIRYLHYSIRTEQAYVHWVRAFVRFHGARRHPAEMGGAEVEAFLSWLANERRVSVSTHKQALSALVFLYQKVLALDLPWLAEIGRPKVQVRLPEVLHPSRGGSPADARRPRASRPRAASLRHGHAHHGRPSPAREGHRFRAPGHRRERRQRARRIAS